MMKRTFTGCMLIAALLAGCAHLKDGSSVVPSPGTTDTPSPAPGSCGQPAENATVLIAMGAQVTATLDPTYGALDGYAASDVNLDVSNVASVITVKTTDIVQFVNVENGSPGNIVHSAVGLGKQFPTVPYTFPASAATSSGSVIGDPETPWSTGDLAPLSATGYCFSQTLQFTRPGNYFFGDRTYYNTTNMRDVIVVH